MKKKKEKSNFIFTKIGEKLRGDNIISEADVEPSEDRVLILSEKSLKETIQTVLGYSFTITNSKNLSGIYDSAYIYFLSNNFQLKKDTVSEMNNYINFPVGGMKGFSREFDKVAEDSRGSNLLGVLRMDIDNLGNIFQFGLKEKYSVGRITTLSSMLIYFFSFGLSRIIDENWYDRAIIVYSGGDDLFIIGQWDVIPDIALEIRNRFQQFTSDNPVFSLSAGIALVRGKYPVYKAADHAGAAEESAKSYKRKKKTGEEITKNSISFMGSVFDWDEFKELYDIVKSINEIKESGYNIKPLISRIKLIAGRYEQDLNEKRKSDKTLSLEQIKRIIESEKWRWRMVYSLSRFAEGARAMKENIEEVMQYYVSEVCDKNKIGIENGAVLGNWLHNLNREISPKGGKDE